MAVAHHFSYVTFLRSFAGDSAVWDRVTLLECDHCRIHPHFKNLVFRRRVQFPTVFIQQYHVPPPRWSKPAPSTTAGSGNQITQLGKGPYHHFGVDGGRLGFIQVRPTGERVDRPLYVTTCYTSRIDEMELCPRLYLTGYCDGGDCAFNHRFSPLTDSQHDALWVINRRIACSAGGSYRDPKCFRGYSGS